VNQIQEWTGKCQRCFSLSENHTMSIFDVTLICLDCRDKETKELEKEKEKERK